MCADTVKANSVFVCEQCLFKALLLLELEGRFIHCFFLITSLENLTLHMRLCLTFAMMDASLSALTLTIKMKMILARHMSYFECL